MQPVRLVSSVSSAVELQGLQKCDEGFFLLGREIHPKAVPLDRARPTVVALETRGNVVIAKAGQVEPVLKCGDRAIVFERSAVPDALPSVSGASDRPIRAVRRC